MGLFSYYVLFPIREGKRASIGQKRGKTWCIIAVIAGFFFAFRRKYHEETLFHGKRKPPRKATYLELLG
jgi:hypothetical protein